MDLLPEDWLPYARMKRIHIHWTAGAYKASSLDKKHYHFLVEGDGNVIRGHPSIKDNEPPVRRGRYAAHTLNGNSGSIAISMCCMAGAREVPFNSGKYPMTIVQWDKMCQVVAMLSEVYHIPVTPITVLTHAEVQPNLGIRQRGKWDVTRLPWNEEVRGYRGVGNYMRDQIKDYLDSEDPVLGGVDDWPREVVVTADSLNVRLGANAKSRIVDVVEQNELLEATGLHWNGDTEWWSVNTQGRVAGWVARKYIEVLEDELDT